MHVHYIVILLYLAWFLDDRLHKSSAVAEMGDRGHKTWAEKRGGAVVPLSWGSWVPF